MYTLPEVEGETDVVVLAQWAVSGTDGTYSETLGSNTTQFTISADDPNFTPYDELTEEQVVGWIKDTLGADGVASYEATIAVLLKPVEIICPALAPTAVFKFPVDEDKALYPNAVF